MKTVFLSVFLGAVLTGCGAASPGTTPEETADVYANLRIGEILAKRARTLENQERALSLKEDRMPLWADQGQFRKDLDAQRAVIDFIDDNRGAYDEISYDITDIRENKDGSRTVVLKFWMNQVRDGSRPLSYYLIPEGREETVQMALIEGNWMIR